MKLTSAKEMAHPVITKLFPFPTAKKTINSNQLQSVPVSHQPVDPQQLMCQNYRFWKKSSKVKEITNLVLRARIQIPNIS